MNKLVLASVVMGLLGAAIGFPFGGFGNRNIINFGGNGEVTSTTFAFSIVGAVIAFVSCLYFSLLYLEKMRGKMGKHSLRWGTLYGGLAGGAGVFVWSICFSLTGNSRYVMEIFMIGFSGVIACFLLGSIIGFFLSLIFGPFFISRITKEPD